MGNVEDNVQRIKDRRPSGHVEHLWRHHHGAASIDITSPPYPPSVEATLVTLGAAGARGPWEAAMPLAVAAWYLARPPVFRDTLWLDYSA